jgi:hypothetical protein
MICVPVEAFLGRCHHIQPMSDPLAIRWKDFGGERLDFVEGGKPDYPEKPSKHTPIENQSCSRLETCELNWTRVGLDSQFL